MAQGDCRCGEHAAGCLVCGAPILYEEVSRERTCVLCGRTANSNAVCAAGHFVCDGCHTSAVPAYLPLLLAATERDPGRLLQRVMDLSEVHMHGPEHHGIVPAVLLTAYRNCGGDVDLTAALHEAARRSGRVPGGACGNWGSCGAAIGAGIYGSMVMKSTPLNAAVWSFPQALVARCLERIVAIGGPRCCKRTARIAVETAAAWTEEHLGVAMPCEPQPCTFSHRNGECLHERCPFHEASEKVLRRTFSVCPVCLRRVEARKVRRGGAVFLEKTCPEHGVFSAVVWRDREDLASWVGDTPPMEAGENPNCPHGCGICPDHRQGTCCVVLEVTNRCNLSCSFCFAEGGSEEEPSFEKVRESVRAFVQPGSTLVQLSGGEPTVRDDLPEIVAAARELGCRYVQLNSNGLRLADDEAYLDALAGAGLSFVFMQFDGVDDAVYERLRGRPLLDIKRRAIERCAERNIGVTLVPTLVPGVNTHEIGDILRFAVAASPAVRGVHFQPVSYFGRIPAPPSDDDRFTLDDLLAEIKAQAGDLVPADSLVPSRCDHPLCGFHGDYIVLAGGVLHPLSRRGKAASQPCCCGSDLSAQNREYVGTRWERTRPTGGREGDITDMDYFLERFRSHSFTVTSMAFQDAGTLDVERLRRCSLHVYHGGKLVPFCARYLTAWGRAARPSPSA